MCNQNICFNALKWKFCNFEIVIQKCIIWISEIDTESEINVFEIRFKISFHVVSSVIWINLNRIVFFAKDLEKFWSVFDFLCSVGTLILKY